MQRPVVACFRHVGTKGRVLPPGKGEGRVGTESGGRGRCTLSSPDCPYKGPDAVPLTEDWPLPDYPKHAKASKELRHQAPGHGLELKPPPGQTHVKQTQTTTPISCETALLLTPQHLPREA